MTLETRYKKEVANKIEVVDGKKTSMSLMSLPDHTVRGWLGSFDCNDDLFAHSNFKFNF